MQERLVRQLGSQHGFLRVHLALKIACSVLLVAGCGESDSRDTLENRPAAASDHALQDALVVDGRTFEELVVATDLARIDYVFECMTNEGWNYDRRWLPGPSEFSDDIKPPPYAPAANQFLELLTRPTSTPSLDPALTEIPTDVARAQTDCMDEASAAVADPLAPVNAYVAQATQDLEAQVVADPRVQAARVEVVDCLERAGSNEGNPDELYQQFYDRAAAIYARHTSGALTRVAAEEQLVDLANEDARINSQIQPCIDSQTAVQGEVRAQAEELFVERHGDALREKLEEGAAAVRLLEKYWPVVGTAP